jgi:hypothetical protein
MKDIQLKDLNLHDTVLRYEIDGIPIWKSFMEYPLYRLFGDPIAYIYAESRDGYPPKKRPKTEYYYLFHLVIETKRYELVGKGTDFQELNQKGDELQAAFREKYVGKREDYSELNN